MKTMIACGTDRIAREYRAQPARETRAVRDEMSVENGLIRM